MSQRRNYGRLLLLASLVLGVFLLTGSFIWMQDKANMILAVFVLILYGIGQWMTIAYWQNIQSDWESTGEVLARLQQAVSDIPAALDSNLKSIATRLSEGQAQALSKLQSEVSSGAKETLEKGSVMIGDSLAKNLASPLEAMKALLTGFAEKSADQTAQLQALTQSVRDDSRKALTEGAALITGSLDKNLRAPLSSLEATMGSWQQQAAAQIEASRAFGEEVRKAQREWSEKAQRLADGLSSEFKSLAASTAQSGEDSRTAWAERAAEVQTAWETQIQGLQSRLLEDVVSRVEGLQSAQSETQDEILERALSGLEGQAKVVKDASAEQARTLQEAAANQAKAMKDAAAAFEAGLERMRETSLRLVGDVDAKATEGQARLIESISAGQTRLVEEISAGQNRLVEEISGLQRQTLGEAAKSLEAQGQLGLEVAGKVSELADSMRQGSKDLGELAHVSQINQTEMQAGVAMLNSGLSSILDRLEKQADAGDGYQTLLAELGRTLASFQERAGEVLVENAMKTQEILMEVLHHQEVRGGSSGESNQSPEQALASVQ
ncbi:MAG: hypothetical protein JWP91_485 [Fibrobacteres bacterium]|nr:hypothetical protein [Fibrobacterota bacterium]